MARKVIGILVGVAIALLASMFLKWLLADYAFAPAGLDPSDPVQAGQIMARMPALGLLGTLLAYFLSAVSGGFLGARIAHARWAAWTTGGLFAALTLLGQVMSRFPLWLVAVSLVVIGLSAWLAGLWAGDPELEDEADAPEHKPAPRPAPWATPAAASEPEEPVAIEAEAPAEADADAELFEETPAPEPVITRPRYASFEELRAAAPRRDDEEPLS